MADTPLRDEEVLSHTRSVCPVCFAALPASIVRPSGSDAVYIRRTCPEHGEFSGVIWRGAPDFEAWRRPKSPAKDVIRQTETNAGCPHDCGRCPQHKQYACTVLFEITERCNLSCPVCFADAGNGSRAPFLPFEELATRLRWIKKNAGDVVLQVSGGEPTLHPALSELVRLGSELFPAVQLNTNGILLAEKPELCQKLVKSGLSWVFLQFDGTNEAIYRALRGKPLLEKKLEAIANCEKAGLSVVLVPTIARGVNDHDLGNLMRLALSLAPTVRGLHLQPMTGSGRNALGSEGLTLPETLIAICEQSEGLMRPEHATPPGCEHERCSFHCRYHLTPSGGLSHIRGESCCCSSPQAASASASCCSPIQATTAQEETRRAIDTILRSWQGKSEPETAPPAAHTKGLEAFDTFIAKAKAQSFSVTCMAFQEAMNLDLERLQGCCVHIYSHPDRLIPFCARNLTSLNGTPLHPRQWG